ncbi:MAG: membrane-bound lytic murein transglycosylase MltF [Pseudomonadota bacterium]
MAQPERRREQLWTGLFVLAGAGVLAWLLWVFEAPEPERPFQLDEILERGTLRVATINSPVTYFNVQDREIGLEYDLATGFAEKLGVSLEMVPVERFADLFEAVTRGAADVAAASITATTSRAESVRFGPPYQAVTQQVVYRSETRRPRTIADLAGLRVSVIEGSSYAETLEALGESYPEISWSTAASGDIESIFAAIVDRRTDATIADSNIIAVHQRFFPELRTAFSLTEPQPIAWALAADRDDSFHGLVFEYFAEIEATGRLERIRQRHTSHLPTYDLVNTHYFRRHIETRLRPLLPYFEVAAQRTGLDWKLLAAMAYQESHWRADAVSPTGVRGLMMLTRRTARELGVEDREDPRESILAGALYLVRMRNKIPARIEEPDRTWMALAAYNIGWGHLEDARIITQRQGGDPDRWSAVRDRLPLLSDPDWYRNTRFGYARGREPVRYVSNIRSYYDILNWKAGRQQLVNTSSE